MELSQSISKLEIPLNSLNYDEKTKRLSLNILGFTFIGHYKKTEKISEILNDIQKALSGVKVVVKRTEIYFVDDLNLKIPETLKLKELNLKVTKVKITKQQIYPPKKKAEVIEKKEAAQESEEDFLLDDQKKYKEETLARDEIKKKAIREESRRLRAKDAESSPRPAPTPPASAPPSGAALPSSATAVVKTFRETESLKEEEVAEEPVPKETRYDINMGLQYYSIMMERQSYLFYVYFSHKELVIQDEEGKVVYKTKITIITTKEEPPVLDLRVEGEGFEVHPLSGKVEVKKEFVNPPVMIFSILPLKLKERKSKDQKKEGEKRFLHVYIDYENKSISHTVLTISVQPKFYRIKYGPFQLNLSKTQALAISLISILITVISATYSLLTIEPSSSTTDILGISAPGLGSLIFVITFLVTLVKRGIFPIKEQLTSFLNIDKGTAILK